MKKDMIKEGIVNIYKEGNKRMLDARDLYGYLNIGRDFPTWIRAKIKSAKLVANEDYITTVVSKSSVGRPVINYDITVEAAIKIVAGMRVNNTTVEVIDYLSSVGSIESNATKIRKAKARARKANKSKETASANVIKLDSEPSNVILRENEVFGTVRFVIINHKEYAVAKDVAKALGYSNHRDAIARHCKENVKGYIESNGGYQYTSLINDNDINLLIQSAKTRSADYKEEFRQWLIKENILTDKSVIFSRKEIEFLDKLEEKLKCFNLECIRQYKVLNYKVDLYIKNLNIAIEYDENDHKNYSYEKQQLRQSIIRKELGCKFIRISDSYSDSYNIRLVMEAIQNTSEVNNDIFGNIRYITINNKPYFVAYDIAKSLGYKNISRDVQRHCKNIIKAPIKNTEYQNGTLEAKASQEWLLITEGDIYRLITRSNLPAAQRFESWIFDEVLPDIRQHGFYATGSTVEKFLNDPDAAIQLFENYKKEKQEKEALLKEKVDNAPKLMAYEDFINSDGLYSFSATAKMVAIPRTATSKTIIGRNTLLAWLRRDGVLISNGEDRNTPYQRFISQGLFEVKPIDEDNESNRITVKVTPKGVEWLYKKYRYSNMPKKFEVSNIEDYNVADSDNEEYLDTAM